jgi:hypothetical protein
MSEHGQPENKAEKRLLLNWGGAMLGVIVGGLGGAMAFGHGINNPPLAALLGAGLGGLIGFGAPDLLKLFHKAQ